MELSNVHAAAAVRPPTAAAPVPQADLRPTADAAALSRDAQPDIPLVIPPGTSQAGAVSRALVASAPKGHATATDIPAPTAVERLLKPYGIAMLPDRAEGAPDQRNTRPETDTTES